MAGRGGSPGRRRGGLGVADRHLAIKRTGGRGLDADGDDGELQRAGGAGTLKARGGAQDWTGRGQCSRHETCREALGRGRWQK